MSDADIYIGWKTPNGKIRLSKRHSSGNSAPDTSIAQDFTIIPVVSSGNLKVPNSAAISFSFTRPLKVQAGKSIPPNAAIGYIWAGSDAAPSSPDSATSDIPKHTSASSFTADMTQRLSNNTKLIVDSGSKEPILKDLDKQYVFFVHGTLMFIAWAVAPFAGIFVARYLKDTLGAWWFRLHVFLMLVVTGFLSIAAFIFIFLYESGPHFTGDEFSHRSLGLAVTVILIVQIALGFVCDALFKPDRKSIPIYDVVHWWLGRISLLLALVTCFQGLQAFGSSMLWKILFIVWICVSCLVLAAGEYFIGQINHMHKQITSNFVQPPMGFQPRSASLRRNMTDMKRHQEQVKPEPGKLFPLLLPWSGITSSWLTIN